MASCTFLISSLARCGKDSTLPLAAVRYSWSPRGRGPLEYSTLIMPRLLPALLLQYFTVHISFEYSSILIIIAISGFIPYLTLLQCQPRRVEYTGYTMSIFPPAWCCRPCYLLVLLPKRNPTNLLDCPHVSLSDWAVQLTFPYHCHHHVSWFHFTLFIRFSVYTQSAGDHPLSSSLVHIHHLWKVSHI